jgi:MFS transporter, DHA1 family, multidrug resistance protein
MGYALVVALCFGCLFAYVSGSSLVLIGLMGVSPRFYGALFASTSMGLVAGSSSNAQLNRRGVSHTRLILVGLVTIATLAVVLLVLAATRLLNATELVSLIVVSHVGHAIVRANAAQGALEPMPEIAGVASAVLTGLQMIVGAVASAIAAALFDGHSAVAMTGTMSVRVWRTRHGAETDGWRGGGGVIRRPSCPFSGRERGPLLTRNCVRLVTGDWGRGCPKWTSP